MSDFKVERVQGAARLLSFERKRNFDILCTFYLRGGLQPTPNPSLRYAEIEYWRACNDLVDSN